MFLPAASSNLDKRYGLGLQYIEGPKGVKLIQARTMSLTIWTKSEGVPAVSGNVTLDRSDQDELFKDCMTA
jgi:hypothetical protein